MARQDHLLDLQESIIDLWTDSEDTPTSIIIKAQTNIEDNEAEIMLDEIITIINAIQERTGIDVMEIVT